MPLKKPHKRGTRKIWDPEYLARASTLSMEAWHHSNIESLSEFLAHQGVRNLFLTNQFLLVDNMFQLHSEPPYCVLLESSSVGSKWGTSDMLLDMSRADKKTTKKDFLQVAAGFDGSVYLLGVELSEDEASEWWDALRNSPKSPHRLYFLYRLLSSTRSNEAHSGAAAAQHLMDAIIHNKRIKEVTVFLSDLEFGSATTIHQDFSLCCLHLEKVSLSDEFLEALSKLNSRSITKTLALLCRKGSTWHPWLDRFLEWQLEELTLLGFDLRIPDLSTFLTCLQRCNDTTLHSLSVGDAKDEMSMALNVQGTYPHNDSFDALVTVIVDALYGSSLPLFDVQGLQLNSPAIEACLLRNQRRHFADLKQQKKVSAMALRLFVCGDAFAGKTTLSSSLAAACSKRARVRRRIQNFTTVTQASDRTQGIEVHTIKKDGIHITMWDMAGQREFHAFHDHMFQDSNSNHSSPAMFMFVWSPVASNNEGDGNDNSVAAFADSFRYWLKFIASKTRRSNLTRKVIVAVTRKDLRVAMRSLLNPSIDAFKEKFKGIVDIVAVHEVDARSTSSVKPLASLIFATAKDVLHHVETYAICSKVSGCLSSPFRRRNVFRDQPIIKWDAFEKFLEEKFKIKNKNVQRAIASSLNESGDIIYLGNSLVLDTSWFCRDIVGKLIHFPESLPRRIFPIKGFANLEYVESILENATQDKVPGSQLVDLMEAMNLCCKDPNDPQGKIFIAATLSTSSLRKPGAPLAWRGNINGTAAYLGRRLECDRKDLTFLTPGLFPMLQVLFLKAFGENGEIRAHVELDIDIMSICIREKGMEIILESGISKGEHVIDVMARAPELNTLTYVENTIIHTVIRVCAQPEGNQGVKLVEGVIHPDCLIKPASLKEREDQCVLIQDLKQKLRRQLEAGKQKQVLMCEWEGKRHQPFGDLLGVKVFEEVLLLYKKSLESADEEARQIIDLASIQSNQVKQDDVRGNTSASTSTDVGDHAAITSTQPIDSTRPKDTVKNFSQMGETISINMFGEDLHQISEPIQEDLKMNISDENGQQILVFFIKTMVSSIYQELHKINNQLYDIKYTMRACHEDNQLKLDVMQENIYQIRDDVLPKVLKIVEQTLYFAVGEEAGKLPRLVFLTTDQAGRTGKIVRSITGLERVRIELFCEHRDHPHKVEGQNGLCVTVINDGKLKKALPWLNMLLKLLSLAAKVGAHVVAGAGNCIPDLARMIALGLDTPGFLDNQGLQEACSSREALEGWQQWLCSVLKGHGGISESNITHHFKLRRAIYHDTSYVAWLCPEHFPPIPPPGTLATGFIRPYPLIS